LDDDGIGVLSGQAQGTPLPDPTKHPGAHPASFAMGIRPCSQGSKGKGSSLTTLKVETSGSSETSVPIYQFTRCHIQTAWYLHFYQRENFKSRNA